MSNQATTSHEPVKPSGSRLPPRLAAAVGEARQWVTARKGRATAVAVALFSLVLVAAVALLGQVRSAVSKVEHPEEQAVTLFMALDSLEHGFFSEAREVANKLRRQPLSPEQQGGPSFVFGAVAAHEAADMIDEDQKNYYAIAARYLEESRAAGFPRGHEDEGYFLLGKSLCLAGRPAVGREMLERALEGNIRQAAEARKLLAKAYGEPPGRDPKKALENVVEYNRMPDLPSHERHEGLMLQARMIWELGDAEACLATLDQIPPDTVVAPDAALLRGRLLLETARKLKAEWKADPTEDRRLQVTGKYDEAMQAFRRGQDDPLRSQTVRQSLYLMGVCYQELEDSRAALAQFARARNVFLETPEGIVAALREAELLRELEQHDDAIVAYRRALGALVEGQEFVNPWITTEQFRTRVLEAYRYYLDAGEFDRAVAIAERLSPLFSAARQVQVLAETYRTRAIKVLADASSLREPETTEAIHNGRALWRKAGRAYEELANINYTSREYADDLWQAAEAYLQGHDFKRAAAAFDDYLKHELRRRRPRALAGLAEARLALNDLDGTLSVCEECSEFYPQDAATYRARLLSAQANLERGELTTAESLLRKNLTSDLLTPESREWRDSLFTLGKVLHADGRYDEAIQRLQEFVTRYPDTQPAVEGRYLIAEAYREAAKVPAQKLETDAIETARVAHQRQKNQYLAGAIENYEQVQSVLNHRQEQRELTMPEKSILRNSYFALGSAQFDLGRYEDAIVTYSAASNRYQHDPEVLEAFVQMATCHRRLNRPLEVRGTLQQAKVVLDRLPNDAAFSRMTNFNRREWTELLEWLSTL